MITITCMALLLIFLGFIVIYADNKGKKTSFFDSDTTTCMRGLWCVIILLVHIPADYQNFIQDKLGSFAYIGVSFFFMTSGYGLTLSAQRNPTQIKRGFWKRRLLKLLIPMMFVNVARTLAILYAEGKFLPLEFISITGFVRQLLFFYLVFWVVFKFLPDKITFNTKCRIICLCVLAFSVLIYYWDTNPLFGWPVESLGFAYGVLLAGNKERFQAALRNKWFVKSFLSCLLALALGAAYLLFKDAIFIGDYLIKIALGLMILLFILFLNTKLKFGNGISRFLGGISYEIYLIHDVVFVLLAAISAKMNSGIFVILSIVISIIMSVIINKLSKVVLSFVE